MASDDTDSRLWQDAIALFERLRDLDPAAAARALAEASEAVRERVLRMQRAESGSGPLDQRLPDAGAPAQLGRWAIGPVLGRGGMSVVYRARSMVAPEEQVAAVKLLAVPAPDAPAMARFEREIAILAQLRHPGIASLYDAGVAADGRPWFAMALVEGEPIDAWCRRTRPALDVIVDRVAAVADAVAHAHRHLVVHRDIKPGNVMVDADGRVVLLDFGISRVLEEGAAELTSAGNYPFTPRYAAPEQREGRGISTATDVYGLGALLHALVFEAAPAWQEGRGEVELPTTPRLPDDLRQVLAKALAREPSQRYAAAAGFADDLRAWRQGRPVQARQGGRGYRFARWVQRNPVPATLAAALALSLLLGTGVSLWQAREARAQAAAALAAQAAAEQSRQAAEQSGQAAERERDRAEALNRFVLGLFSAQLPNRPLDELPTTAELLDLGVERARDPASGEPALRAQMLSAIANVFQLRSRPDEARDLIAEAVALAREDQAVAPAILVDALRRKASMAMTRGDFALADAALAEALPMQEAIEGGAPASPVLLGLRRTRAMALGARHDYAGSLALFEAIHREVAGRDDLPPGLVQRAGSDLALAYSNVGRYADALPLSDAALAADKDDRSLGHAIGLSNNGRLRMFLGDFAGARSRIEQAIGIYDGLFDSPSGYRGAARFNLGRVLARQGDFEAARVALDAASEEWARSDGRAPDNYAFTHLNRIEPLVLAGRWADVAREAARGRALLLQHEQAEAYGDSFLMVEATLAIAHCRSGRADEGRAMAGLARERLQKGAWPDRTRHAMVAEAEAECLFAGGDPDAARQALAASRAEDPHVPAGEAHDLARREDLAARIAEAAGDAAAAARARQASQAHLDAMQLPDGIPAGGDGPT
jgi:hypothetical protein